MTKIITGIVIVVAIVGLVIWDLVVNFNKIEGDTISEMLGYTFRAAPILAVVLGVVVGHLASNFPGLNSLTAFIADRPVIGLGVGTVVGFLFWNMGR